jgi:hypothetical protein
VHIRNVFCTRSCAARFNNIKKGPRSDSTKRKISQSTTGRHYAPRTVKYIRIFLIDCKVCHKKQYVTWDKKKWQTCGDSHCKVIASTGTRNYQNGSRKPAWFFNPYEQKEVLLESSWEVKVAEHLISRGIRWVRPAPLEWIDSNNINRLYFPDFHLPDHDLYLDPKNPYCMKKDKEKLDYISNCVTIVYGDINKILRHIDEHC